MWDASPSQIRKEALKLGDAREGKLTLLLVGLIIATSRTMTGNEAGTFVPNSQGRHQDNQTR